MGHFGKLSAEEAFLEAADWRTSRTSIDKEEKKRKRTKSSKESKIIRAVGRAGIAKPSVRALRKSPVRRKPWLVGPAEPS